MIRFLKKDTCICLKFKIFDKLKKDLLKTINDPVVACCGQYSCLNGNAANLFVFFPVNSQVQTNFYCYNFSVLPFNIFNIFTIN